MTYDLESLRLLWWCVLGLMLIGLILAEGLSMGAISLLPMLATTDRQQSSLIKAVAPSSLANLGWLVVFMLVLFAAWPVAYAVSLASFYPALLLVLLALSVRPVALYFFDAIQHPLWVQHRRKLTAASAWLPASLFGLLIGNIIKGIPFHLESDMQIRFLGDFAGLFNLFSLLVAATGLALLAMHGSVFLWLKTSGELRQHAKAMAIRASVLFVVLFAVCGLWITHLEGYHITSDILPNAASNPLAKFVKRGEGLWLDNYEHIPALWAIPVLAFADALAVLALTKWDKAYLAMLSSSLAVAMTVSTFAVSMFPFLLPSNISLNSSLTIWDSSASPLALKVLLNVALYALPLMAVLSRWSFCLSGIQVESSEPEEEA